MSCKECALAEPRNRVVQVRRFGGPDGLEVVDAPLPTAAVVDQSALHVRGTRCRCSFFANDLATLLSSTTQPVPQVRKPDECWYGPTISKASVPIRTRD